MNRAGTPLPGLAEQELPGRGKGDKFKVRLAERLRVTVCALGLPRGASELRCRDLQATSALEALRLSWPVWAWIPEPDASEQPRKPRNRVLGIDRADALEQRKRVSS